MTLSLTIGTSRVTYEAPMARAVNRRQALGWAATGIILASLVGQLTPALAQGDPGQEPSSRVIRSLCRPSFVLDGRPIRNGTGFLLAASHPMRQTYLFLAQHLISAPSSEMSRRATSATCTPWIGRASYEAGPAVTIEGAHPMGPLSTLEDVAVFPVRGASPGLPLAVFDVHPGDQVWLLAPVKGGVDAKSVLHRGVVVQGEGFLAYSFDDRTLNLDQTSGGAVLNSAGEVVGLNVGYTHTPDGRLIGVGDRLSTLRRVVAALP